MASDQQPPETIDNAVSDHVAGEAGREFYSGALFLVVGVAALWFGRDLGIGATRDMGPGYFPMSVAAVLSLFGLAGLWRGRAAAPSLPMVAVRPILMVTLSVIAFGLALERFGLFLATLVLCGVAALASDRPRWGESAAIALGLAVLGTVLFGYALSLTLPLWPQ